MREKTVIFIMGFNLGLSAAILLLWSPPSTFSRSGYVIVNDCIGFLSCNPFVRPLSLLWIITLIGWGINHVRMKGKLKSKRKNEELQ